MSEKPSEGIGERLAKYRRLAGLSARELAERAGLGVSRGVIANIESGRKHDVTVDQLIALSAVLGIPPAALALPLDEPFRYVRLTGQSTFDDERISTRASDAVRWFNGARHTPGPPQVTSSTIVAFRQLRLLEEYWQLSDKGRSAIEEGLEELMTRMQEAGFDLNQYKVDE